MIRTEKLFVWALWAWKLLWRPWHWEQEPRHCRKRRSMAMNMVMNMTKMVMKSLGWKNQLPSRRRKKKRKARRTNLMNTTRSLQRAWMMMMMTKVMKSRMLHQPGEGPAKRNRKKRRHARLRRRVARTIFSCSFSMSFHRNNVNSNINFCLFCAKCSLPCRYHSPTGPWQQDFQGWKAQVCWWQPWWEQLI